MVVGGIISAEDDNVLRNMGVAAIYTPKDYALDAIMADVVKVVERSLGRRVGNEKAQAPAHLSRKARSRRRQPSG